jgi:hypothetical protein
MSNFFYSADGKKITLEGFSDVASTPTFDDALILKGNLTLDGVVTASRFVKDDGTLLNEVISEKRVYTAPVSLSFDAQGNMTVGNTSNKNNLIIANQFLTAPDETVGSVIANDTDKYKQLMIVGNKSSSGARTVGIWDKLNVNGQLCVGSTCVNEDIFAKLVASISQGNRQESLQEKK